MPNQRAIAAELGMNQATVSLALRGHHSIPEETRNLIVKTAERLGYRPNAYVSSLMSHIRSGRPLRDKGCLALLFNRNVDDKELADPTQSFARQRAGAIGRAEKLGFYTEQFSLQSPGMTARRIDRVFFTRNIRGIVLMAPGRRADVSAFDWNHFTTSTIAYSWDNPDTHRVATDHRHHVDMAYEQLYARGFERIGLCLPPEAVQGVNGAWTDRFLYHQYLRPGPLKKEALFVGTPSLTTLSKFRAWYKSAKPDALITLQGHEQKWLDQMKIRVPQDVSLVCLNRPLESHFSGMEENNEVIGATAVEMVVQGILDNNYGLPTHPKLILIKGSWAEGKTLAQSPKAP